MSAQASEQPSASAWASPESNAPGDGAPGSAPPVPAPGTTPKPDEPRSRGHRQVPQLTVFDRPLTIADTLDGAFAVLRARPRTVVLLALCFVLPVQLLSGWLSDVPFGSGTLVSQIDQSLAEDNGFSDSGVDFDFGNFILLVLLQSLAAPAIAAVLARLIEGWQLGRDLTLREVVRSIGVGWLWLYVAWILVHLLQMVSLLGLVVGALVPTVLLVVTAPVIAIERCGPFAALKRSTQLVRRRFSAGLWIVVFSFLVSVILLLFLPPLPQAVFELLGLSGSQYVGGAAEIFTSLLTTPFTAAATVLYYFDLRVRTEGLDLELAVIDRFEDATPGTGAAS